MKSLAVGDAAFQKKCLGKMGDVATKEGRTVLFVSHSMQAIAQLTKRCILLHQGKIQFDVIPTKQLDSILQDNKMVRKARLFIKHQLVRLVVM